MLEMGQLLQPLLMPPQVCDLVPAAESALSVSVRNMLYVPMDAASFDVHGACFTGPMQVKWIGQLCELDYSFVLHIDGKHTTSRTSTHNCAEHSRVVQSGMSVVGCRQKNNARI